MAVADRPCQGEAKYAAALSKRSLWTPLVTRSAEKRLGNLGVAHQQGRGTAVHTELAATEGHAERGV